MLVLLESVCNFKDSNENHCSIKYTCNLGDIRRSKSTRDQTEVNNWLVPCMGPCGLDDVSTYTCMYIVAISVMAIKGLDASQQPIRSLYCYHLESRQSQAHEAASWNASSGQSQRQKLGFLVLAFWNCHNIRRKVVFVISNAEWVQRTPCNTVFFTNTFTTAASTNYWCASQSYVTYIT